MSLEELTKTARAAADPVFTSASTTRFGGVDPLGLRQINFDLMDEVLPGLNNVARHIRPFVVVAWAWRRAKQLAERRGERFIRADSLRDFVDRVEVLFVASQLMRDAQVDLPGNDYLRPLLDDSSIDFDGAEWKARRKHRRDSTSLSAAINYGPGLRSLHWLAPHQEVRGVMMPTTLVEPALDAFEDAISRCLSFGVFNTLDGASVRRKQVEQLADAWSLDDPTRSEKDVQKNLLIGPTAPISRQQGMRLVVLAAKHCNDSSSGAVRAALSGRPASFRPPAELVGIAEAWRRVQVRQLFRLALEALHYWIMIELEDEPRTMTGLVDSFLKGQPSTGRRITGRVWLENLRPGKAGPTELMDRIQTALADLDFDDLAESISVGLAFCLREPSFEAEKYQPSERLPLSRARREFEARAEQPVAQVVKHVLESWVLAQHAYWSVGRGLGDARSGGKILLRLKVILDDGGWNLTPGAQIGSPPVPTRDRLQTALSLARECGLLN